MIVSMKKVTVLCLESDRDAALERLREMGIVHVEPVRVPEDSAVDQARRRWEHIRRALDVLPHHPHVSPSGKSPEDVVEAVWEIVQRRRDVEDELGALRHEKQRIEPFGDFDPASVRDLAKRGIRVRLFQADPSRPIRAPEGTVVRELCRTKQAVCLAALSRDGGEIENAHEVRLPEMSLGAVKSRISELEAELRTLDERLSGYGGDYPVVATLQDSAEDHYRMAEVRAGMGEEARIAYLRGFAPERETERIREAAAEWGWGLRLEDPAEEDAAPTLIRHPRWVRPIQSVLDLMGILPGYREVDISKAFLLFFSLFFAMIVGDAGYGFIFLGLTALAYRKWRHRTMPDPFQLMTVLSVATIVWGLLTGNIFGTQWFPTLVPWLDVRENLMLLCFVIGAVHLTVAHAWNAFRIINTPQALAQFGWIALTWTMFLTARTLILSRPFPVMGYVLLSAGLLLVVVFMTPLRALKKDWVSHAMLPLTIINNFVDVVSYVRLFAVGYATLAVAEAFNSMAMADDMGVFRGLLAALILFAGHALNIVLCGLSVLVHGLRLNTLEFSGHIGMQWTGVPFRPFTTRSERTIEGEST